LAKFLGNIAPCDSLRMTQALSATSSAPWLAAAPRARARKVVVLLLAGCKNGSMDAPDATDWITAVGTFIAAGAAIVAAGAAVVAARAAERAANIADGAATTWRDTLENQRYDECVASAAEVLAAVNRCISAVKGKRRRGIWPTYTAAWDRQTSFRSAFEAARRYRSQNLRENVPGRIDEQLNLLNPICATAHDGHDPNEAALDDIASRVSSEVNSILPASSRSPSYWAIRFDGLRE
jgi:hypothetical protein